MALDPDAVRWDDHPIDKVTEMVSRRVANDPGGGRTIVRTHLRKGAIVARHVHAGEQTIRVVQGSLAVTVAGRLTTVNAGGVLVIPARTPHQAEALDDSVIVDIRDGDVEFGG